jgi:hypothetical protein
LIVLIPIQPLTIEFSVKPIAFTHANPKRFGDHIRNSLMICYACAAKVELSGYRMGEHLESSLGAGAIEDLLT